MKKYFLFILATVILSAVSAEAKTRVPFYRSSKASSGPAGVGAASTRLNEFQRRRLKSFISGNTAFPDTLKLLVVQVQFADSLMGGQPNSHRPEVRDSVFFSNELKHLRDYFTGASRGRFVVEWDLAGRLYDLPEGMNYYGNDAEEETRVVEMAQSIIDSIDTGIDLSRYQSLFIIHAGAGQETDSFDDSRNQLWSSFYDLGDIRNAFPDSSIAGLATGDSLGGEAFFVDNFIIAPSNPGQDITSIGSLGIWAFSVGSRIGLLPLFDSTPASGFNSMGAGNFCLMSWGLYTALAFVPSFPCAFNRMMAGWIDPLSVDQDGTYVLHDINTPSPGDTSCLKIAINENEYYLVVNRVHDTNFDSLFTFVNLDSDIVVPGNADSLLGAEFDFFLTDLSNPFINKPDPGAGGILRRFVLTGSGVYVWHINTNTLMQALQSGYLPNDFSERKAVDLEEADGIQDLDGLGFFSQGSYFDSFRLGHNDRFADNTTPSSRSDAGASTGITLENIGKPGSFMSLDVIFDASFSEVRASWQDSGRGQPASPVDLDGGGSMEAAVFAGSGNIYAFTYGGLEYDDKDMNPATIEPYLSAPGADWTGPGAFGVLDGVPGDDIVGISADGTIYAWSGTGTQIIDGDSDPSTDGVLFKGSPAACPPLLVDINGDGIDEIALIEHVADSLHLSFVNSSGAKVIPSDPAYSSLWPAAVGAQFCAPLAYGACGREGNDNEGIVISWVDTVASQYGLSYFPLKARSLSPTPARNPVSGERGMSRIHRQAGPGWTVMTDRHPLAQSDSIIALPPALGDLDADGFDEAVLTLPDGRLQIYDASPFSSAAGELITENLRGAFPSPPSLGDIDKNGSMEIALWDSDYYYVFTSNGKPYSNWPQRRFPIDQVEKPRPQGISIPAAPLVGDMNGDGKIEILYASGSGVVNVMDLRGDKTAGFPRTIPTGVFAAPSFAGMTGSGELSLLLSGGSTLFEYLDPITDSLVTSDVMELAVQELPGSNTGSDLFWYTYRNGSRRWGRAEPAHQVPGGGGIFNAGSFLVYPNPVPFNELHARLILHKAADIGLELYNLEGENVIKKSYPLQNPGSLADYTFDEKLDIAGIVSGVYFLRINIKGKSSQTSLIKTVAIRK